MNFCSGGTEFYLSYYNVPYLDKIGCSLHMTWLQMFSNWFRPRKPGIILKRLILAAFNDTRPIMECDILFRVLRWPLISTYCPLINTYWSLVNTRCLWSIFFELWSIPIELWLIPINLWAIPTDLRLKPIDLWPISLEIWSISE